MYTKEEAQNVAETQAFQGRSPQAYLKAAHKTIGTLLAGNPLFYQQFGPYAGLVYQALPDLPDNPEGYREQPDYLSPEYDLGDAALNVVAAMMYLNRHGIPTNDARHLVRLSDGSEAWFIPFSGLTG